jgi:hypothetical protein
MPPQGQRSRFTRISKLLFFHNMPPFHQLVDWQAQSQSGLRYYVATFSGDPGTVASLPPFFFELIKQPIELVKTTLNSLDEEPGRHSSWLLISSCRQGRLDESSLLCCWGPSLSPLVVSGFTHWRQTENCLKNWHDIIQSSGPGCSAERELRDAWWARRAPSARSPAPPSARGRRYTGGVARDGFP